MIGAGALVVLASLVAPRYALAVGIFSLLLAFAIAGLTPALVSRFVPRNELCPFIRDRRCPLLGDGQSAIGQRPANVSITFVAS